MWRTSVFGVFNDDQLAFTIYSFIIWYRSIPSMPGTIPANNGRPSLFLSVSTATPALAGWLGKLNCSESGSFRHEPPLQNLTIHIGNTEFYPYPTKELGKNTLLMQNRWKLWYYLFWCRRSFASLLKGPFGQQLLIRRANRTMHACRSMCRYDGSYEFRVGIKVGILPGYYGQILQPDKDETKYWLGFVPAAWVERCHLDKS